ncbi:MAG: glycosyltransferase family 2 protein, partial [Pseudolabrys sp.]
MQKISAYILTYNEAEKIAAAISSVLWTDEVVVIDSSSTDRTAEIATSLGARVVQVPFNGFGELRNRAVESCKHGWIFSLDADERCTQAVRDEILALLAGTPPHDVYRVPRKSYMMGRWIRGSGWYPNFRQPQLFRKGSMRYTLEPVHEGYENLSGKPLGTLANAIWQLPFRNL